MDCIFNHTRINNACLYIVLATFPMVSITAPVQAQLFNQGNQLQDTALMFRLKEIVDKLTKLEKKGTRKEMIDLVLEVKHEVEIYSGKTISLDQKLNEVYKEIQKKGYKIPKKQFDRFTKEIKQREKKSNKKEKILFRSKHNKDEKDEEHEKEQIELPVRMTFGITLALCGVFLCCLPHPQAKKWGTDLIIAGVTMATESGLNKAEKDQEERKNNNKK